MFIPTMYYKISFNYLHSRTLTKLCQIKGDRLVNFYISLPGWSWTAEPARLHSKLVIKIFYPLLIEIQPTVFTVRAMLCAVYAMAVCLCVSLSVCLCLSQVGVLLKRLNVGWRKERRMIAQGFWFSDVKNLFEIQTRSPPTGAPNAGGVGRSWRLSTNNSLYLENGTR